MKCHVCGGNMEPQLTDMPFKLSAKMIAILKDLPMLQCENCRESVIANPIVDRVRSCSEK